MLISRASRFTILSIFFLGLLIYGQSATYEFVLWDDYYQVVDNSAAHGLSLENIVKAFRSRGTELYAPLSTISYQVNYVMSALRPHAYHVTNILLHFVNTLLVGLCIFQFTENKRVSRIAMLLFLVLPVHAETVAWVSARKDLLCTLFYLSALFTYIQSQKKHNTFLYVLSITLFLAALLSKAMALSLPIVLFLLSSRKSWPKLTPFFVLSGLFGLIAIQGKQGPLDQFVFTEQLLMIPLRICTTLLHIVWPFGLSPTYELHGAIGFHRTEILVGIACFVLLAVFVRLARTHMPIVAQGIALFIILLSPTLLEYGHQTRIMITYDRYAYLSSIGIVLIIAFLLHRWLERKQNIALLSFAALLIVLSTLSWQQVRIWQNTQTLFEHALALDETSPIAKDNLEQWHREHAQKAKALDNTKDAKEHLLLALSYKPTNADIWNELGAVLATLGEYEPEAQAYKHAITYNPNHIAAHYNLARNLEERGKTEEAIEHYKIVMNYDAGFHDVTRRLSLLQRELEFSHL